MTHVVKAWHETSYENLNLILNSLSDQSYQFLLSLRDYILNTVEHLILACLLYITLCILMYFSITKWRVLNFNRDMRNSKRILFVIAHPDDEVMFFAPTILNYTKKKDCEVYLVCLSTGKNYGMGTTRTNELYNSCKVLGIKEENIYVHSHTNLPDMMDVRWPTELVAELVLHHVTTLNITNIVTFDRYGVSNHCNHCCVYYAVATLILDRKLPKNCGVFVLETVNIVRKYWLILDIPLSFLLSRFRYMEAFKVRNTIIHEAMKQHASQLVWFRKLYMYFSRYMVINTLQQMNLVDIELDLEIDD